MKSLKNILPALLVALLASMTMVSCLDSDNDDNTLTPELEKQARTAMSNIYTGKLIFKNLELDATKFPTQVDTIKGARVKFAYSDSTAVVYSLPAKLLFKALDGNESLKKAAEQLGEVDLTMKYAIYSVYNDYVYFASVMKPLTLTLDYDGETHKIGVDFITTNGNMYSNGNISFNFAINAIYDGVGTDGKPKLLPGGQLYSPTMEQSKLENILFVFGGAVK